MVKRGRKTRGRAKKKGNIDSEENIELPIATEKNKPKRRRVKIRFGVKKRRSNPKTPQRQTEKTANKNHQTVFELVGWVQQTICCGVVFRGPHGEVLILKDFIHQHDGPCMYNNKNTTNGLFANIPFVDEGHDSQHDIPDTGCSTPQTTDQDDSDQEGVNVQINGNKTDVEFENPPETDQSLPSNQEDTTNIVLNSHDI